MDSCGAEILVADNAAYVRMAIGCAHELLGALTSFRGDSSLFCYFATPRYCDTNMYTFKRI